MGTGGSDIATALWWIDAAMALACGIGVPLLMFTRQEHSVDKMTAVWLLPIVAAEVTASSAGPAGHRKDWRRQILELTIGMPFRPAIVKAGADHLLFVVHPRDKDWC